MPKMRYYEDVEIKTELPSLVKRPTTRQLVRWAASTHDYAEMHYDKDVALRAGLPGVIVHGNLSACSLGQMVVDWVGEPWRVKKLSIRWRGIHFPGQEMVCKGTVSKKYVKDGEYCIECELWTENPKGDKCTIGTAIVTLRSKERDS